MAGTITWSAAATTLRRWAMGGDGHDRDITGKHTDMVHELTRRRLVQRRAGFRHIDPLAAATTASPAAREIMVLVVRSGRQTHPGARFTQSDGSCTFASSSKDLRFLDVATIDHRSIADCEPFGAASHALVIHLGFGHNLISATRIARRINLDRAGHLQALCAQGQAGSAEDHASGSVVPLRDTP